MKLNKHALIVCTAVLAVFLVLAFIIPFSRTAVYWIGFGCTIAMFICCGLAFVRAFRRDETLESKLLGWPIFKVGYTALAVQACIGFVFMALARVIPVTVAVIIEVLLFALTMICLTVKDAAREVVRNLEGKDNGPIAAWKAIRTRAVEVASSTGNAKLKELAEVIRFADPNPTPIDGQIAQMLEVLSGYADQANIKKAFALMEQRTALAKEAKQKPIK